MRSGRTFIAVSRASRDMLKNIVAPAARTIGDVLSKVKERASIRRADRENSKKDDTPGSAGDDVSPEQLREAQENWQCLAQTEYGPADIMEQIQAGRLSPDDILIRK
jgi:hypothetical protein